MAVEARLRAGQRAPQSGRYHSKRTGRQVDASKGEKLPDDGLWQLVETERDGVDPLTGMTDAEIAELARRAYEERGDLDSGEEVPRPEISTEVRSVVSVRFNPGELAAIERAARSAGVPLSSYIRNAALTTASPVDVEKLRGAVEKLQRDVFGDILALSGTLGIAGRAVEILTRLLEGSPIRK
jgi:uncharacterized protein (DUF1778 family)